MGLLGDLTAYIDARKRVAARNAADLASNPGGLLNAWGGQVKEDLTNNMQQMGAGVTDRAALGQSISAALGPASNAPLGMLGHIVYHGSPHKFDKFDASKIGTGEGAQAYGYGVYLAESPDVAKYYRQTGINATPSIRKGGVRVEDELLSSTRPGDNVFMAQINADTPRGRVLSDADLAKVKHSLSHHADLYAGTPREAYYQDALKRFDELKAKVLGGQFGYEQGSLYKVDLPDEWLPKMLDWDKPLSQQNDAAYKVFRQMYLDKKISSDPNKNPVGTLMIEAQKNIGSKDATNMLRDAGIPGIRYLDGGSRGSGEGTYNYVVFPGMEGLLKILERQ